MKRSCQFALVLIVGFALHGIAAAHTFAPPYTLPVPFTFYAFGAAAALVLSFVIVGVFATAPSLARIHRPAVIAPAERARSGVLLVIGRVVSVALLLVCIVSGLFGTQNSYANINMTFFWIVFVLGVAYAVAIVGDFYAAVNPWRVLVDAVARVTPIRFTGRLRAPERLHYYPALVLYMAFIWVELFGRTKPWSLSVALIVYTALNFAGAWWMGRDAWFRQGEFFAVFMRLLGKMSPWARPYDPEERAATATPRWRAPFSGLLEERAEHISLLLFILFMLSSTAFDGLHDTAPFASLFWKGIYPWIAPLFSGTPAQQYALSAKLYYFWQWTAMLISPLVYLAVYVVFVAIAKFVTRSTQSVGALALRFAMSLVPIAFVYHVTHYYTLLLSQGGQMFRLVSDPLGRGWDLFGTGRQVVEPLMIDVEAIWHTQVALILLGHIVSVYLAHLEALQIYSSPRRAAVSQLPLLVLMMLFTTLGLWILSLPLGSGG
ncbi:MAG: hypothetical protein ABIS28_10110 [Caldimonas sp.]